MRVLHLVPYYAPAWGFGGVVRAVHGLAGALAAQGHAVTVLTTDAGDRGQRLPVREEMLDGVRVLRCRNLLPVLRKLNLSSPVGMGAVLRSILADTDILHLHEFRTVENLWALMLARHGSPPVVLSPHGTLGYGAGRRWIKRGWDALAGRWSARRIDHVAALTADEAAEARALWQQFGLALPDGAVSVIPNGVDAAEFAVLPPAGSFRERWRIPSQAPLVLFMGRLHRRKGVHLLVEMLALLPQAWLAVVGPDEGELAGLQALVQQRRVADRVVFTGLLTGVDKLAALADATVLALPAVGEGLPMVVLEAMVAGLPVAISDECHLPEVIQAGAGVRLEPLEAAAIAAALGPVLADPAQRESMGRAAQALVADRFTWERVAAAMTAVYQRLQRG
ncbi:MAG: glycosyltransferase [Anaerolineae bacterium]|nr:glycosyltransferase [Anaerolineae bacterium]